MRFEIDIEGVAGPMLRSAVGDVETRPLSAGQTRLVAELPDQTALRRVLQRLDDLHVTLIEVRRADVDTNP